MYKSTTFWAITLLAVSMLVALPAFAHYGPAAQAASERAFQEAEPTPEVTPTVDPDEEDAPTITNPVVLLIAQITGLDPEVVLAAMVDYDAGLGEMLQAARLAEAFDGVEGMSFEELLAAHQGEEGTGWGEIKSALRWSAGDPELAAEILARKAAGEGWGQIKKSLTPSVVITPTVDVTPTVAVDPDGQIMEESRGPRTTPPGQAKKLDPGTRRGGRK
ncbi:MAG: hypothetical protein ACYC4R_16645 [Anaerolineae bacterium]